MSDLVFIKRKKTTNYNLLIERHNKRPKNAGMRLDLFNNTFHFYYVIQKKLKLRSGTALGFAFNEKMKQCFFFHEELKKDNYQLRFTANSIAFTSKDLALYIEDFFDLHDQTNAYFEVDFFPNENNMYEFKLINL